MSVWLTPSLKPYIGGTYFPPDDSLFRRGFKSILKLISEKVIGILFDFEKTFEWVWSRGGQPFFQAGHFQT